MTGNRGPFPTTRSPPCAGFLEAHHLGRPIHMDFKLFNNSALPEAQLSARSSPDVAPSKHRGHRVVSILAADDLAARFIEAAVVGAAMIYFVIM